MKNAHPRRSKSLKRGSILSNPSNGSTVDAYTSCAKLTAALVSLRQMSYTPHQQSRFLSSLLGGSVALLHLLEPSDALHLGLSRHRLCHTDPPE